MRFDRLHRHRCSAIPVAAALISAAAAAASAGDDSPAADGGETPEVRILNWRETQELIREKFSGRVVLMQLWTTTCPICREEFPEYAGLQQRFADEDFAFVSLNCDYDGVPGKPPAHYLPQVAEFLQQQEEGAALHVMLDVPLLDFFDAVDLNSAPAVFLYDRDGELVQRFDNDDAAADEPFTIEEVSQTVERLIRQDD